MIPMNYRSPRWSNEVIDCSMPMTFDTYSVCSYNCLYCFSFFQRHWIPDYRNRNVRAVDPEEVKRLFLVSLGKSRDNLTKAQQQFVPYIQGRYVMQWGGLSDGFDEYERRYGVSLRLLKFFDQIDYPLSISTKGVWWTKDHRYMDLFKRHAHNWHVKMSIITLNQAKARALERGCPTPKERLDAIERLADIGTHVTLRLRPFVIGVSEDYMKLINVAAANGADSVTTEWFCLEMRANAHLKSRYAEISKVVGYDIHKFYKENSKRAGYLRLNPTVKAPIVRRMRDLTHSLGLRFYVSDCDWKGESDHCCCCGVPPDWKVSKGHFAEALQIAKEKGEVSLKDIAEPLYELVGGFSYHMAEGFNEGSNKTWAKWYYSSLADYVKSLWNDPKEANSPVKYFNGALIPDRVDDAGNIVYRYGGLNV